VRSSGGYRRLIPVILHLNFELRIRLVLTLKSAVRVNTPSRRVSERSCRPWALARTQV
jgi:hypothetical protein